MIKTMNSKRSASSKTPKRTASPRNVSPAPLSQDVTVLANATPPLNIPENDINDIKEQAVVAQPSTVRRIQGYEQDWQRWDRLSQQLGNKKQSQALLFHYLMQMVESQSPEAGLSLSSIAPSLEGQEGLSQEAKLTELMTHIPQLLSAMTSLTFQFQQNQQQQQQLNVLLTQVLQTLTTSGGTELLPELRQPTRKASRMMASTKDSFATLDSQNLKRSHAKGSAEEKLRRAFEAIVTYNEALNRSDADKWAINQNALAELTGCNRPAIKHFLTQYGAEIERHHQSHGLLPRHNYAHGKLGTKITDIIFW
jgi:hypothetical protein